MSYFALTPARLARISSASRGIFGHLGSDASPWGPGKPGGRRSPRPYLHKKLKFDKIARLGWPSIRPQLLEGKWWRQQEEKRAQYEDQWMEDRAKEDEEVAEKEGRRIKKEVVPLKKGKKREGKGE